MKNAISRDWGFKPHPGPASIGRSPILMSMSETPTTERGVIMKLNEVMSTIEEWKNKLRELNAIKAMRRDGELDGDYAIQPSNKRWFEWLSEWPVEFNREWTYEECDFEGLGL